MFRTGKGRSLWAPPLSVPSELSYRNSVALTPSRVCRPMLDTMSGTMSGTNSVVLSTPVRFVMSGELVVSHPPSPLDPGQTQAAQAGQNPVSWDPAGGST